MSFDLKIENRDIVISGAKLKKVEGQNKLIQDILKICLTEAGSNPLHPGYGSYIHQSVVGSTLGAEISVVVAKNQLNNALENLKLLQDAQVRSYQRVNPEELIAAILAISVEQNKINPTLFDIRISVANKAFSKINTQFNVNII